MFSCKKILGWLTEDFKSSTHLGHTILKSFWKPEIDKTLEYDFPFLKFTKYIYTYIQYYWNYQIVVR